MAIQIHRNKEKVKMRNQMPLSKGNFKFFGHSAKSQSICKAVIEHRNVKVSTQTLDQIQLPKQMAISH